MWEWEENSILHAVTPYTPTKDIFHAVCHEIGRYYQNTDFKYLKSKRSLKWKGKHIQCEFRFWSSHSNMCGEWVNLEIVTSVSVSNSCEAAQQDMQTFDIRPQNFNIYGIDTKHFAEITTFIDDAFARVKLLDTQAH